MFLILAVVLWFCGSAVSCVCMSAAFSFTCSDPVRGHLAHHALRHRAGERSKRPPSAAKARPSPSGSAFFAWSIVSCLLVRAQAVTHRHRRRNHSAERRRRLFLQAPAASPPAQSAAPRPSRSTKCSFICGLQQLRHVGQVLAVVLRHNHLEDARAMRRQQLLLQAADRQAPCRAA